MPKERKKVLCMDAQRHAEYYGMQQTFDELYAKSKAGEVFNGLMELVLSPDNIMLAYRNIKTNTGSYTAGTDKQNIGDIGRLPPAEVIGKVRKIVTGSEHGYRPKPVRRKDIPKPNGKTRPLGIPCIWDRLVQQCIKQILEPICEAKFSNNSYGFRPNRSVEHAISRTYSLLQRAHLHYVLEFDIKGFFDNLDQRWLMKFLEHDIADKNFLRYISRFLKSGIVENGAILESDKGTPQGGQISPILANVYLHYVLDLWCERILKQYVRGEIYYVRYADDFLLMFQYEEEAKRVLELLRTRLAKFGLEVAEDKTRILPIGRFKGTKEDFDFLGFTFFNTKTRGGKYRLGVRTSKKKQKMKKQAAKAWLKTRLTKPVADTMRLINLSLAGHYNYYGVSGNFHAIQGFYKYVKYATYRMLNRRDQKGKFRYTKFLRVWKYYVKEPHLTTDIWNWKPTLV